VNVPGGSWIQPPGLGESVNDNPEDYQEEYHCDVCEKMVTVEFDFNIYSGEKIYLLDPHERDFHGKCPHCHKIVPAIWDDRRDARDFSEHRKVCSALPASWAICKGCREKIYASLISTPQGRIHDFSKHNTTCLAKTEEKIILFHCDNCGEGVTNKSDFFENHSKPCFERACVNKTVNAFDRETGALKPLPIHFYCKNCGLGITDKSDFYESHKKLCDARASAADMWYVYDRETGTFVGPQPALSTQSTTPKTATPHGAVSTFGEQSAPATPSTAMSAASSSRTPPTSQHNGKAPARERRPAMPLFRGHGGRSSVTPHTTGASSSWQGNVTNYQSQRPGPATPNTTGTSPSQAGPSSSERRPPMPSFGGKAGSRPKTGDGPQWQGNVIEYG
jgi:hypothetical protein